MIVMSSEVETSRDLTEGIASELFGFSRNDGLR
jgi:hypothetical protein